MRKRVIVNFSVGTEYLKGQQRLKESLKNEETLFFNDYDKIGSPSHYEVPYAFKLYAIYQALLQGYSSVLWLDSSIVAVKPLDKIWEIIETKGYFMEEAGHWLGRWTNDRALKNFGIDRETANNIPMYSAGLTGLDFSNQKAVDFFKDWFKFATDGETFKGDWKDHRHDMSAASFLAWKYQFELEKGGTYCAYIGTSYEETKETVIFNLIGI